MDWQAIMVVLGLITGMLLKHKTPWSNKIIPLLILIQSFLADFTKAIIEGGNIPPIDTTALAATDAAGAAMLLHGLATGLATAYKKVTAKKVEP